MIRISCWSQDTGHIEIIIEMTERTAYNRLHAQRLRDRYAAEDSSTDHVYEIVVVEE